MQIRLIVSISHLFSTMNIDEMDRPLKPMDSLTYVSPVLIWSPHYVLAGFGRTTVQEY